MDFLEKTYIDNGITYYIDVEALSAEIDLRRGEDGVQGARITSGHYFDYAFPLM